jgi:hypothetical protein
MSSNNSSKRGGIRDLTLFIGLLYSGVQGERNRVISR